jgi:hypothetical protein
MEILLETWDEVLVAIAGRWQVLSKGADIVTFAWPASGRPEEVLQAVHAEIGGRARVVIGVQVAAAGDIAAQHALKMNAELLIGSLMILNGAIVSREVLTVGRFDATDLQEVIAGLVHGAGLCRARVGILQASPAAGYID